MKELPFFSITGEYKCKGCEVVIFSVTVAAYEVI